MSVFTVLEESVNSSDGMLMCYLHIASEKSIKMQLDISKAILTFGVNMTCVRQTCL